MRKRGLKIPALLMLAVLLLCTVSAAGENPGQALFEKHTTFSEQEKKEITWWLYTPAEIREDTTLVVFLHGSGEMGEGALTQALPAFMADGTLPEVPALVLVPQLPKGVGAWVRIDDALEKAVAETTETYGLKPENAALCGFSMGGIGAMDIANRNPGRYQRILVAAGRVNKSVKIASFTGCEVRFYVGKRDFQIRPETVYSFRRMLERAGIAVSLTELNTDHLGTMRAVFTDPEAMRWLFTGEGEKRNESGELTP